MKLKRFLLMTVAMACGTSAAHAEEPPRFRLSIQKVHALEADDCDGLAAGDISGDGKLDLLTSNGKGGATFWYRQGATPWEWTRHPIHTPAASPGEIEGNDLGDFDGDGRLEAISLNQPKGQILLHKAVGDPAGEWKTVVLRSGRPLLQASLVTDIDGDGRADLVYTWEGNAPGRGGVHWLRFGGGDVLNPEHWTEHVMVQHESAWWLAPRPIDLNGNGRATDLVFTARNLPSRNRGTKPGVFWLEEPDDVTGPWKLHTIDTTLKHPLHVDLGDLSGRGHGKDIVVGGFDTRHISWYSFSEGWKRYDLPLPDEVNGVRPDRAWNVKTARFKGERDGVLVPVTGGNRGALLFYEFLDGRHVPNALMNLDYQHPMDDRIVLHDLDGDGLDEAIIPDSGTGGNSRLVLVKFRWR